MKPKQILFLVIVLVVLVAGVAVKEIHKPAELSTELYTPLELSFDAAKVSKIEISKGTKEKIIELTKDGDVWKVPGLWNVNADPEKISQFLDAIRSARGELRGQDHALFPDFGISDDTAYRIKLLDSNGTVLLDFLAGTKRPEIDSVFVRQFANEKVYAAELNLYADLGIYGEPKDQEPEKDFWAEMRLLPQGSEEVSRIEIRHFENGKETVTAGLSLEADPADASKKKWVYLDPQANPSEIDVTKVSEFTNSLKEIRAQKILAPETEAEKLQSPEWQIKIVNTGQEMALNMISRTVPSPSPLPQGEGKGEGNGEKSKEKPVEVKEYLVKVSGVPVIFQLSEFAFKEIAVENEYFAVPKAKVPEAEKPAVSQESEVAEHIVQAPAEPSPAETPAPEPAAAPTPENSPAAEATPAPTPEPSPAAQ